MTDFLLALKSLLVAFVILGAVPLLVANYQFLLVGLHFRRLHYAKCRPYFPRTAILIPAWNEAAVIGTSIDRLMLLDYPRERLRIYVVDDASTDDTPQVVLAKMAEYPGNVVHLRREKGGEGKAATLNHGLAEILADDWMQAILIMDSDVIYEPSSLRRMTRHLADPGVGSVTAYIKEGSRPGNYMTRFIGYEYITAQAAARRSQEVLGVIACLAGGAQLHSRANIEAIGGQVDTTTLAEDTVTTFETQKGGRRVIFEPHATVWAEEPGSIVALWKQRLRWARGNVQVTRRFKSVWFRPQPNNRLGSVSFGLLWFCLLLLPVFMVLASASLVTLFFIDYQLAWTAFHVLWLTNVITYIFITSFTLAIDPGVGRHTWKEALMFPGLINVIILRRRRAARPGELDRPRARRRRRCRRHPGLGPRHRAVHLRLALGLHGGGLPRQGRRVAAVRPRPRAAVRVHRRLRALAVRDHHGRLHQGTPARRGELGQDREDGEDGGAHVSGPEPAAGGPVTAEQARVFEDEVRDAVRYERGLAVKCLACILARRRHPGPAGVLLRLSRARPRCPSCMNPRRGGHLGAMSASTLDRQPSRSPHHGPGRRSLTPLLAVTAAALVFTILLVLVRLQWRPLESVDHGAAARINGLIAGHPRPGLGGEGGHLAGQRRRAVDDHRGLGGLPGLPAPLAAGRVPPGHRRGRAGHGPDPQGPGRPAAPGGGPPDRARRREQLPQRPLARVDRLLRRGLPGLPARPSVAAGGPCSPR